MSDWQRQLQTSNWLGIFKYKEKKSGIRKIVETFPSSGRIGPFGESFQELVSAVAFMEKLVAEFDWGIYSEEKDVCDIILQIYGLDQVDDPKHHSIWIFRPENRLDALQRISEINKMADKPSHEHSAFEDHKKTGKLYGYSDADIDKFLSYTVMRIIVGRGERFLMLGVEDSYV